MRRLRQALKTRIVCLSHDHDACLSSLRERQEDLNNLEAQVARSMQSIQVDRIGFACELRAVHVCACGSCCSLACEHAAEQPETLAGHAPMYAQSLTSSKAELEEEVRRSRESNGKHEQALLDFSKKTRELQVTGHQDECRANASLCV